MSNRCLLHASRAKLPSFLTRKIAQPPRVIPLSSPSNQLTKTLSANSNSPMQVFFCRFEVLSFFLSHWDIAAPFTLTRSWSSEKLPESFEITGQPEKSGLRRDQGDGGGILSNHPLSRSGSSKNQATGEDGNDTSSGRTNQRRQRKIKVCQRNANPNLDPQRLCLGLRCTTASSSSSAIFASISPVSAFRASVWVPWDFESLAGSLKPCDWGKLAPSKNALIAGRFSDVSRPTRVFEVSSCAFLMMPLGLGEQPGEFIRRLCMALRSLMDSPVSLAVMQEESWWRV